MKLQDALKQATRVRRIEGEPYVVCLACGFTPLHLSTFLVAHLSESIANRRIECSTGLYGDLIGALGEDGVSNADSVAVVVEWPDLDPRLGLRRLGGWGVEALQDAATVARDRMRLLAKQVKIVAEERKVVVSMPSLPLPVAFHTKRTQVGQLEWEFQRVVAELTSDLIDLPGVNVVNARFLDYVSPPVERHDPRAELHTDFPYTLQHASALAGVVSDLLTSKTAFKGIITDLDDTVWRGLVGEVGPENVAWDLEHQAQVHGIYQQLLQALAESGTLVAVASKNDKSVVDLALAREDLLVSVDRMYPVEAGWGPKSKMVERILEAWNVGADSVVFIDDTEMELAEVGSRFPMMTCLPFKPRDEASVMGLLGKLRDTFGRSGISEEDQLRMQSIRQAGEARRELAETDLTQGDFLQRAEAELTFSFAKEPVDQRAIELINKTNQFNLNGERIEERAWREFLNDENTFQLVVSYRDKFGPLGKIAVIAGNIQHDCLRVDRWVMSCRAFSRHIEYRCLEVLYDNFAVDCVELDFKSTQRNQPIQSFLQELTEDSDVGLRRIERSVFGKTCPKLYQRVNIDE